MIKSLSNKGPAKQRNLFLLCLTSVILLFITILIGAIGHDIKFSISCLLYFSVTMYFHSRGTSIWSVIAIMLSPVVLLYLPIHLLNFADTRLSLPSSVAPIVGCFIAMLTLFTGRFKLAAIAIVVAVVGFMQLYGYKRWINYLNYGQFTTTTDFKIPQLSFVDEHQAYYGNEIFNKRVVILDFWTTACGACFLKFPILQNLANSYQQSSEVSVYAVNIPLKRDTVNQSYNMLRRYNFTFPNLNSADSLMTSKLNIEAFPTTLVIVNGIVKFKGDIEDVQPDILETKP